MNHEQSRIDQINREITRLNEEKSKLTLEIEKTKTNYDRFKELYHKDFYPNDEYGIWDVYGEDPNCDFGGNHSEPHLGQFEGKYDDVLRHAVELSGFWQWGGGGRIVKGKHPTIIKV